MCVCLFWSEFWVLLGLPILDQIVDCKVRQKLYFLINAHQGYVSFNLLLQKAFSNDKAEFYNQGQWGCSGIHPSQLEFPFCQNFNVYIHSILSLDAKAIFLKLKDNDKKNLL